MLLRVRFSYNLPKATRVVRFAQPGPVQAAQLVVWLYENVMGGPKFGKPRQPTESAVLSSAHDGLIQADWDGQPVDTELLEVTVGGAVLGHWSWLFDGDEVVLRRRPYELQPLAPFEPQPRAGDLLNMAAFAARQEMVAAWEARHARAILRRARELPPGVKRRVQARGIPQINLRKAVTEEELDRAMVNPIGGALVVMKTIEEQAVEAAAGAHMRYVPVT